MSGPLDPNPTSGIDSGIVLVALGILLILVIVGLIANAQVHEPYIYNYLSSGGV